VNDENNVVNLPALIDNGDDINDDVAVTSMPAMHGLS